eukprot:scaffold21484_cov55-Attheya_sp.AAC.4
MYSHFKGQNDEMQTICCHREDTIMIPRELVQAQQHVTMAMDRMMVNSLKFLATISKNLFYRTAHYVARKKPEFYMQAIDLLVII